VPTSTDVACIGSGKAVKVTEGTNQTGVVQGEGTLSITGGSLEVANVLEASSIKTF
jgi:adhesin HecA-like repeat protein